MTNQQAQTTQNTSLGTSANSTADRSKTQMFKELGAMQAWLNSEVDTSRQLGIAWIEVPKEKQLVFDYMMDKLYPDPKTDHPQYFILNDIRVCLEGTKEKIETTEKLSVDQVKFGGK